MTTAHAGAATTCPRRSRCRRRRCGASGRPSSTPTAERVGDEPAPRPVAYLPHRLLVPGLTQDQLAGPLRLLGELGREMQFTVEVRQNGLRGLAEELGYADRLGRTTHSVVELRPDEGRVGPPLEAWSLLQRARAQFGKEVTTWALNHVLMSTGNVADRRRGATWAASATWAGSVHGRRGLHGRRRVHGRRGLHGRGRHPRHGPGSRARRARDALPAARAAARRSSPSSTPASAATRGSTTHRSSTATRASRVPIGLRFSPAQDPEEAGVTVDVVNGALDPLGGHGTFVAGVVRQHCPDARLVVVPVMYGDGAADEADVIEALGALAIYHWSALDGKPDGAPIDVVNLSLGYYHETPQTVVEEGALFDVLRTLAADGVAVIAAAGNGGTTEHFWPAALAESTPEGVPFTSVGATNPADGSVAIFSNTRPWVSTYSAGVAVVSTMPVTLQGSLRGDIAVPATASDPARGTPDPDRYVERVRGLERHVVRVPVLRRQGRGRAGPDPCRQEPRRPRQAGRRAPWARPSGVVVIHTGADADSLANRAANAFRSYRDGQPVGMSTLVDEVTPLFWAVARQQGLAHQGAEDVVQNTWLKLVETRPRSPTPAVLKWLITTTKRDAWAAVSRGHREEPATYADVARASRATSRPPRPRSASSARPTTEWCGSTSRRCPSGAGRYRATIAFAEQPDYASVASAGDAGRQRRSDPGSLPCQAPSRPRLRPAMGDAGMNASPEPEIPLAAPNARRRRHPRARALRHLHEELDPLPGRPRRPDQVRDDGRGPRGRGRRDRLERHPGDRAGHRLRPGRHRDVRERRPQCHGQHRARPHDRVDIVGWVTETGVEVELRERGRTRTTEVDPEGRFTFGGVERGLVNFVLRRGADSAPRRSSRRPSSSRRPHRAGPAPRGPTSSPRRPPGQRGRRFDEAAAWLDDAISGGASPSETRSGWMGPGCSSRGPGPSSSCAASGPALAMLAEAGRGPSGSGTRSSWP